VAHDPPHEEGDGPAGRRRRTGKDILRAIGRTLQMAWSADPRTFVSVLALSIAPAAIPPVMVLLGRRMVDLVAVAEVRRVAHHEMVPLVVALGILAATQRVTQAFVSTRQELFMRRVYLEAERRFLAKAATADLGHFDNSDWYDRVARVQRDVSWRPGQMTWAVMGMAGNTVTLLGMLGILLALHPVLVLLVVASIVPTVLIQQHLNRKLFAFWWVETPEDRERVYLGELLSLPRTAREVRSFNLVGHLQERHWAITEEHYGRMRRLYRPTTGTASSSPWSPVPASAWRMRSSASGASPAS
jgi:ABC-type multidrug transport system fused ATPase/permease subunit